MIICPKHGKIESCPATLSPVTGEPVFTPHCYESAVNEVRRLRQHTSEITDQCRAEAKAANSLREALAQAEATIQKLGTYADRAHEANPSKGAGPNMAFLKGVLATLPTIRESIQKMDSQGYGISSELVDLLEKVLTESVSSNP